MGTKYLRASLVLLFALATAQYVLEDDYFAVDVNGSFFDKFAFFVGTDPTHGTVKYNDYDACLAQGLISNTTDNVIMRADSRRIPNGTDGRASVRIQSVKKYDRGLIVLDLDHMPGSTCGLWPAFWTYGPRWPTNGEIDIIEGINQAKANRLTLHTGPGCYIRNKTTDRNVGLGLQSSPDFSGLIIAKKCVSGGNETDNTGCSIGSLDTTSYGDGFNAIKGGIYATEWTDEYIAIWFFPRSDCEGADPCTGPLGTNPDPSTWGLPMSRYDLTCDIPSKFHQHSIVFDITFCGDWADGKGQWNTTIPPKTQWPPGPSLNSVYPVAGGPQNSYGPYSMNNGTCAAKTRTSCEKWVKNNPGAFKEAYWSVNALRVYQQQTEQAANGEDDTSTVSEEVRVGTGNSSVENRDAHLQQHLHGQHHRH